MKWDLIRNRLEEVLSTPFMYDVLEDIPELNHQVQSWIIEDVIYFPLEYNENGLLVLTADRSEITPHERDLIELTLQASRSFETSVPSRHDDHEGYGYVQELHNWLMEQLKNGVKKAELPEDLHAHSNLFASKIPVLLYGNANDSDPLQYEEFKKLLGTFFETDLILIPLAENEWLILASESVISASQEEHQNGEQEEVEEALESIALGLHEMLVSEWIGDWHLAVDIPMVPATDLLPTVHKLRQMISLGRQFHMESHLHLPWKLKLERLLYLIPDESKRHFVKEVLRRIDYGFDFETLHTLEQFFELDCNVSETARMLYIHRNTLLYRLDKFKQETGLDVRSFNEAVLVNIALLLYKVTKRK